MRRHITPVATAGKAVDRTAAKVLWVRLRKAQHRKVSVNGWLSGRVDDLSISPQHCGASL